MTHVEMIYDQGRIYGFRMKGHAGYNTKGPDILCASLSTASQMTVNGILDWAGVYYNEILVEENKEKAILHIIVTDELSHSCVVEQLLRSFEMYVDMLASQYKGFVSLERREKDDNRDT